MTSGPERTLLRIETQRSGPFTFQLGCESSAIRTLLLRVDDAHKRFCGSPLSQVANRLEKEILVSSIFGTNSIEGGTLSQEETQLALDLDPQEVQNVEQRRALNLKRAYHLSRDAATDPDWRLDVPFIQAIHAEITDAVPHDYNQPGRLRDNPKKIITRVGDATHGGPYKPPQYGKDIQRLLSALLSWNQALAEHGISVLTRAPLVHYYFELIHPFWDGNGRVGRVLEATILQAEGYKYAPFAQAHYYYDHIDAYFALFNACRKAAEKKSDNPNAAFVEFFLSGMLESIDKLHDRVNRMVELLLYESTLRRLHDEKIINHRQYAIVSQVLDAGKAPALEKLTRAPWYLALYANRSHKTKQRDMKKLFALGLLAVDAETRIWPGVMRPDANPSN